MRKYEKIDRYFWDDIDDDYFYYEDDYESEYWDKEYEVMKKGSEYLDEYYNTLEFRKRNDIINEILNIDDNIGYDFNFLNFNKSEYEDI